MVIKSGNLIVTSEFQCWGSTAGVWPDKVGEETSPINGTILSFTARVSPPVGRRVNGKLRVGVGLWVKPLTKCMVLSKSLSLL